MIVAGHVWSGVGCVLKHPDPNPCDPPFARPETGGSSPAGAAALGSLRRSRRGVGHCEGRAIYRKTFTPPAAAWRRVKANAGAAGVDGVTIEQLAADAQVEAAWLGALREELHRKTYRPVPVRRVRIPKASGGFRGLGIPTVKDRVVQMAVYLVLMPIFEADFHPRSFGFRPGRNAHQWRKHGNRSGKYERWPNRVLFDTYGLHEMPTNLA